LKGGFSLKSFLYDKILIKRMLIGNRKINEKIVNQLVRDIKKKKELEYLADSFMKESLRRYLKREAKAVSFLMKSFSEKAKAYKEIVKGMRRELRKLHGLYKIQQEMVKREEYFDELVKTKLKEKRFLELHEKILGTHTSTKERLSFYKRLYKSLFKITGRPKTIVDLGCGINPFSIPLMGLGKLDYYAYDISYDEMTLVKRYFEFLEEIKKGFSGKAGILDLMQWEKVKRIKKGDICFLWKMTDVLDRIKGHKVSERVITLVPVKFVVASFPTFTVKGRRMHRPRRKWIELMCKRLGFKFKVVEKENEIFYVIRK